MDRDPGELQGLELRLGLDIHGVIDSDPVFFSELSQIVHERNGQVFIITGREKGEALLDEVDYYKVVYKDILSITSYQRDLGTPIAYLDDRLSQPVMAPDIWNPTKAALCASAGIHIMIDDSTIYEPFFQEIKTQYIVYTPEIKEFLKILFYFGGYRL